MEFTERSQKDCIVPQRVLPLAKFMLGKDYMYDTDNHHLSETNKLASRSKSGVKMNYVAKSVDKRDI